MSQLQKAITRIQRREGTRIGFGAAAREQPRAMLAGALASDAAAVKALLDAGADVVVVQAADAGAAARVIEGAARKDAAIGATLASLDEPGAVALKAAGCDFVISPLDRTAAVAFDTDRLGHVIVVDGSEEDSTLRALGPLGLDAVFATAPGAGMSVADQLGLVRLSSFSGTPLLVAVSADATAAQLRVLRDSGGVAAIAPAGTSATEMAALVAALKAVPPPRKGRRENDIALVPAMGRHVAEDDGEEDDDDDDD